ncbi:unnamed protein product [Effrenium voratum]|nr:unnamed protein product [Effrenium voratum]
MVGASLYGSFRKAPSSEAKDGPHLAFIQSFEQGDLWHFLGLVQESLRGNSLDAVSASTALHRLARFWAESREASAPSAGKSLEVLVLLSHRLADIFRYTEGPDLQPRHLAITAWAFATLLRCRDLPLKSSELGGLFRPLAEAAVVRMPGFDARSLGNLLWGCAAARHVSRRLFFRAARRAVELLRQRELQGQNLSNVVWSFSQARLPNHALFEEVAKHPEVLVQGSPQHVTNILWAFSRIHGKIGMFREFFDAGAAVATPLLPQFKTQELANLLWSFANQTMYHEGLFAAVASHSRGCLAEFENFDLSQLLWSFAKVWWRDEELLKEAAHDMLCGRKKRLEKMCAQDLGCVLWAFAMLRWPDGALFEALAAAARRHLATLKPLDVGNVAWALAVSKQMDTATARLIADHALSAGFNTADGWVHVLSGLEAPLRGDPRWAQLEARFEAMIFGPLCERLKRLATLAEGKEQMATARQELALLEAWVGDQQLEHLGPDYTQRLARCCGLWSDSQGAWEAARGAFAAAEPEGKRVGLHQSKVVAWLAYSLRLEGDGPEVATTSESGQLITYGRAEREFCPHWQAAERLLLPLSTTSHSRGGHAERVAMLQVFSAALKCAEQLRTGDDLELLGEIRLFVSHWPCVSCLTVLCQVRALAPQVQLHVCWEGYTAHTEPHATLDHRDRASCAKAYKHLRQSVEDGIQYLLHARKEDPFEEMAARYALEQATGVSAPSFSLSKQDS